MVHDSTWLTSKRGTRPERLPAHLRRLVACVLSALVALVALPAVAAAANPDVRGEWGIVVKNGPNTIEGTFRVTEEANASGEFSGHNVLFGGFLKGTFEATLEGAKATVKMTTEPFGPVEESKFNSSTIAVEESVGHLALSGEGEVVFGHGAPSPETIVATRLKTQQQIEEQEAQERKEQEERAARANVRGEWSLTLQAGPQKLKGVALIAEPANAKNEFASKSALFEGFLGGTFSGTLKGEEATVTVTTEGNEAMSLPPGTFTSNTIAVSTATNPASMSGSGTFKFGTTEIAGTMSATRVRTHAQVEEQEIAERKAKEKLEEEAKLAKEKAEQEAKEKAEREAKEKAEREAKEQAEKANKVPPPIVQPPAAVPVVLVGTTSTASKAGALSLKLTNPNGVPASGHLKLTFTSTAAGAKHGKGHAKSKTTTLGEAAFSIVANGSEVVKLTLTKTGRAELAHLKTIRALVTLTTQVSGQPSTTKTYSLTLHSGSPKHKG